MITQVNKLTVLFPGVEYIQRDGVLVPRSEHEGLKHKTAMVAAVLDLDVPSETLQSMPDFTKEENRRVVSDQCDCEYCTKARERAKVPSASPTPTPDTNYGQATEGPAPTAAQKQEEMFCVIGTKVSSRIDRSVFGTGEGAVEHARKLYVNGSVPVDTALAVVKIVAIVERAANVSVRDPRRGDFK